MIPICPDRNCQGVPRVLDVITLVPNKKHEMLRRILVDGLYMSIGMVHCAFPECGTLMCPGLDTTIMNCPKCGNATCRKHRVLTEFSLEVCCSVGKEVGDGMVTLNPSTKMCSKCFSHIEKNGGCNHMTCKCGHQFCWLCGLIYTSDHFTEGNPTGCKQFD